MNNLTKDLIVYAMTNDNPCVYSRGLDNDTYSNLICFWFDYFYLHV